MLCTHRLQLPPNLPPSFKGVAVRYLYTLDACLTYANPIPTPTSEAATGPPTSTSLPPRTSNQPQPSQGSTELSRGTSSVPSTPGVSSPQSTQERPARLGFVGQPQGSSHGPALANGNSSAPPSGKLPQQLRVLKEVAVRLPITIWPPLVSHSASFASPVIVSGLQHTA